MEYICLNDIAKYKQGKQVSIDKQHSTCLDGMVRFVRIVDYTNSNEMPRYIENLGQQYIVDEKSIVMIRYGSQTAGKVVRGISGIIANNMFQISIDDDRFDNDYMYYFLSSSVVNQLLMGGQSSSTMPAITFGMLKQIQVPVRSIDEQRKIASFLESIDKKIENNNKINDNLEQQAQSYFQKLFVNNADPEWTTGTISDLGTIVGGSTPSKAKPEYYTESGIAWITPKDLSINKSKFISHGENDITELGLKNSSAAIMPEGTVLFSSRAPIGYIAIAAGEVTTNQGFKSVVPKLEIGTPFVYFFLKHNLQVIEGMASGSTFKEVSGSTMKNIPAVIPDVETLARFNDFCTSIFAQQRVLEEQSHSLVVLRDNLLPKLMSGEIDVSDIQL